jgi:hypothetical protein
VQNTISKIQSIKLRWWVWQHLNTVESKSNNINCSIINQVSYSQSSDNSYSGNSSFSCNTS